MKQPFPIEVIEAEPLEPFEITAGVSAVALQTPHTDESHAIHIRDTAANKTLVYTADTGFSEPITAFARNVDLLLMECSFVKNKPVEHHLELAEAMYIVRKAAPVKAVFTHLYPEWDDVDLGSELKKLGPAET